MEKQKIIRMRKHALKAIAELECLLEEFDEEVEGYEEMLEKITTFKKWLSEESCIS